MILSRLTELYASSDEFKHLNSDLDRARAVEGVPRQSFAFLCAALFGKRKKTMLVIVKNSAEMQELITDIQSFVPADSIAPFPSWETLPYEYIQSSEAIERDRITTLYRLMSDERMIVVASAESVIRRTPARKHLVSEMLTIKKGDEPGFEKVSSMLSSYGYSRETRVEVFGQYSVKGGIIDVYLPSHENPVRIDFFGDTVESIREFDPDSQVSTGVIESICVMPRKEFILSDAESDRLRELLKKEKDSGKKFPAEVAERLNGAKNLTGMPGIEDVFPLVVESETFADFLPDDALVISLEKPSLMMQLDTLEETYSTLYERKIRDSFALAPDRLIDKSVFLKLAGSSVTMQNFISKENSIRPGIESIPAPGGKLSILRDEVRELLGNGWRVAVVTPFDGQARRLSDLFGEFEPPAEMQAFDESKNFQILISQMSAGVRIEASKTLILSDHDIFGKSYKRKKSFKGRKSRPITSFLELENGEPVVHINHGIGIFRGIERMTAGGIDRDFLILEYAGGDKLYVSLDQLTMVQKYVGMDGKTPRIDVLGKKSAWNRIKDKVRQDVEEIAKELVAIYARRKALKGFAYPQDTAWQEEFESKFEYEETPDQISAIEDVKDDMEKSMPMDRLVCGDVGFGKTEVAIRAAFKAVLAGRQVAILAPTTILVMQHYKTFVRRFEGYPFQIDMMSRFKTAAEIKKTKDSAKEGKVDIIIGTHALLSKNLDFKNLGLLIIDEEQRFGVKHKEQIKKVRSQIDVLTLSATPIPRTLHMSMAGIRDLSVIATPPQNRQSVETYVIEENQDVLRMAINRELDRNGQVFYVHNRVQSIEAHAGMIKQLVPHARVAVAHGQMHEHELEDIMVAFIEDKYDILVATSIIESGLDMPNVNTIIIDRADAFGLSQLYQLKGRVGRSEKKGFAYLFHPARVSLSEVAQKRLNVIAEYTDLGSGFKIAMKDLEIRGAGNILGHEQSGSIMEVGFDLYCQMLEDAVRTLKGEKPEKSFRTPVFLSVSMFIPGNYIDDEKQKIEFYKRFEACESLEEIEELEREIVDRFGEYPSEVGILIELARIRSLASKLFIDEILEDTYGTIRVKITEQASIDMRKIAAFLSKDPRFSLDLIDKTILRFKPEAADTQKKLDEVKKWLQQLS
jgi:transcription-repair coupling factor (superfamily II helicase)